MLAALVEFVDITKKWFAKKRIAQWSSAENCHAFTHVTNETDGIQI